MVDFECTIKSGGTDIRENYSKVIQSMFWAVKANKQMILNWADVDEVLASIPDPKCKAWWMKLNGKSTVDPGTLVDNTDIGPQTASQMMSMKPQEVFELVEEELVERAKNRSTQSKSVSAVFVRNKLWHIGMRQKQRIICRH